MARFRGELKGAKGTVSKLGHAKTGITSHVYGWNSGVSVYGQAVDNTDVFQIFITGGASTSGSKRIGTVIIEGNEVVFKPV